MMSKQQTEAAIEQEIQDKGLTAPRITPDQIDGKIQKVQYHVFEGSCLTVCCLTLANGFTVTGESACASPANFNQQLGEKIAFDNARSKIWALEGYLLKERLANTPKAA
jgi:Phage protein (N4 Gp49/phage Sf6 gene 66) family